CLEKCVSSVAATFHYTDNLYLMEFLLYGVRPFGRQAMPAMRPNQQPQAASTASSAPGSGPDGSQEFQRQTSQQSDSDCTAAADELAFLDAVLESLAGSSAYEKLAQIQQPQPQQPPSSPEKTDLQLCGSVRQRSRIVTNGLLPPQLLAAATANGNRTGSAGCCQESLKQSELLEKEDFAANRNRSDSFSSSSSSSSSSSAESNISLQLSQRMSTIAQSKSSISKKLCAAVSSPDLAVEEVVEEEDEADGCSEDPEVNLQRARVFYAMAMRALSLLQLQDRLLFFQTARQDSKRKIASIKLRIGDLDEKIDNKIKEFDASRVCYNDQTTSKRLSFDNAQALLTVAKQCYSERMKEIMQERKQTQMQLDEARAALQALEDESADLEQQLEATDEAETRKQLQEQLKLVEERLEAQRRIYEDLEFKELEDQSRVEEEREHLFRGVVSQQSDLIHKFKDKEAAMQRLEAEARESAARAQAELDELEAERARALAEARREKRRQRAADNKLRELRSRLPQPAPSALIQHPQHHQFWPSALMTSSGYANHRGHQQQLPPQFQERTGTTSDETDDNSFGTTEASYQSSLMTASLHEDLHGRFNESTGGAAADESCGTYDNPTSLVNSYHEASASDVVKRYQRIGSDSSSGSTVPSLTPMENKDANKKNRPLTRYLPSCDPDFDLREHLLSLGHPLDILHRQVEVTPCCCRGYLTKQGGKFKSWKKRWFVLDRYRKTLAYFSDRSETKIKGCVSFCDILDAYIDRRRAGGGGGLGGVGVGGSGVGSSSGSGSGKKVGFCLSTTERTYRCIAPSPEVLRVWMDSVFTAAEGYLAQTQLG
uniref:PH domain-containing protein n=1 Tax=Macrostomum lignano TaxID=282301 RepID=A0A1I8H1H7_9PLAT